MRLMKAAAAALTVIMCLIGSAAASTTTADSAAATETEPRFTIDVKDTDIRDVIRIISKGYGVNVVLDNDVTGTVTLHLKDVPAMEGLRTLAASQGLTVQREGNVYRIRTPRSEGRVSIRYFSGYLTADIADADVREVIKELSAASGVSIVPQQELSGKISGKLFQVSFDAGIRALLEGNGFKVVKKNNIYRIGKVEAADAQQRRMSQRSMRGGDFYLDYQNGLLSLDVTNGSLADVLDAIAERCEIAIVTYGQITDIVNARFEDVPLAEAFALLLGGTMYTFVQKDNIFLVGDRSTATPAGQALTKSELVHLKHIKADEVVKTLPKNIPATNVQVVKEQNALLISGTSEDIVKAQEFLAAIDIPVPQVIIDAIVVEYSRDLDRDFGLEFGYKGGDEKVKTRYAYPYLSATAGGGPVRGAIEALFPESKILSRLPDDFYLSLRFLEKQGLAKVLAQPSITVLNGNEASIRVGQTQYYRIVAGTSENPTYRFEPIEFGINLKITPWISLGGQITAVIAPEISNPMGYNEEGYPNVFRRSVFTNVRLENGQTLALGGLLRSDNQQTELKVPFLGDIPILGFLFKTRRKIRTQTNLVIYITPRIIENNGGVDLEKELKQFEEQERKGFGSDFYRDRKTRRVKKNRPVGNAGDEKAQTPPGDGGAQNQAAQGSDTAMSADTTANMAPLEMRPAGTSAGTQQ